MGFNEISMDEMVWVDGGGWLSDGVGRVVGTVVSAYVISNTGSIALGAAAGYVAGTGTTYALNEAYDYASTLPSAFVSAVVSISGYGWANSYRP